MNEITWSRLRPGYGVDRPLMPPRQTLTPQAAASPSQSAEPDALDVLFSSEESPGLWTSLRNWLDSLIFEPDAPAQQAILKNRPIGIAQLSPQAIPIGRSIHSPAGVNPFQLSRQTYQAFSHPFSHRP